MYNTTCLIFNGQKNCDTASYIINLRVTCHFNETLHVLNNIDYAIWTFWVQGEGKERFCI